MPVRKLKIQICLICASHESGALPLPGLLACACWWSERDRAARDDEPADVDLRDGHRQDRRLGRWTVGIGPGGRGEAPESLLSAIWKSQEITLCAVRAWAEAAGYLTVTVPCAQLPFAGLLPRAPDVVAASLDFAGQVLAARRRFADGVLAARS